MTAMQSDGDDNLDIPAFCLAAGGDLFAYSGTTTWIDQVWGDQVYEHSNDPMCLPTSCTSNEADIALMIPMIINEAEGESCTGSYTSYDGLGDGTPDSLSCMLDYLENADTITEDFYGLYINEVSNDYKAAQTLCEDNDMDYFTVSYTIIAGSSDMLVFPQCLPSSCTSDEAALKAMFFDTDTDYYFSGLGTTSPPSEAPDEQEENMTSGGSFRASIAGSVLMLAVASALL